ncbi:hypothetical protein FRC01_000009 [Tulasnella sp. 417]|nr:hypothetical protein FRC01_000009 [Tulasnella sp. 417]
MKPAKHKPTLPSELKAEIIDYLETRRDLAAVIRAHSSFQYFAEKRLYHYIDISDDDPYRSLLCLQVVTSRPSDIATYVQALLVEMYSDFDRWPGLKPLFVQALSMMKNVKRLKFHAYRGTEAVFHDTCINSLDAYSGRNLLATHQLDHLSRNAPGLVKLDLGWSPLVPDKPPVYLELGPRHQKTLRYLRINLAYSPDQVVLDVTAKIAQLYPDLQAFHIIRHPLEEKASGGSDSPLPSVFAFPPLQVNKIKLLELLSNFKNLVWFSFTSIDEDPLEEDREFVKELHRVCPTLREIDLTQNRGAWRYLEKEKRWILRAESCGTIWRLDRIPKNPVWDQARVVNPLDYDFTYLSPLSSAEWKDRHEGDSKASEPLPEPCEQNHPGAHPDDAQLTPFNPLVILSPIEVA